MQLQRVFAMKFAKVYPLYIQKAESKNRTKDEVDQIICWLTGYDAGGTTAADRKGKRFRNLLRRSARPSSKQLADQGVVCGVRWKKSKIR